MINNVKCFLLDSGGRGTAGATNTNKNHKLRGQSESTVDRCLLTANPGSIPGTPELVRRDL